MKKIYENRGLFVLAYGTATSIMGFTIFPLVSFIMDKFVFNKAFKYSVQDHIIMPIIFGFVFAFTYSFGMVKQKRK